MEKNRGTGLKNAEEYTSKIGKNYVFAIAIDKYRHKRYYPDLKNPVSDVTLFLEKLKQKFQFEASNIITLKNEEATYSNITNQLNILKGKLTLNDNLIVIFAGHGDNISVIDTGILVTHDTTEDQGANTFYKILLPDLTNIGHHVLLIIDACYGKTSLEERPARYVKRVPNSQISWTKASSYSNNPSNPYNVLDSKPSRWLITSGGYDEVSDGYLMSPFMKAMLHTLSNENKAINLGGLYQKVKERTLLETKYKESPQNPTMNVLEATSHRDGEFIFWLKKTEEACWKEATSNLESIAGFKNYLALFPKGNYVTKANSKIKQLEEQVNFKEADDLLREKENWSGLVNYLFEYKSGKYFDEAKQALKYFFVKNEFSPSTIEEILKKFKKKVNNEVSELQVKQQEIDTLNAKIKELLEKSKTAKVYWKKGIFLKDAVPFIILFLFGLKMITFVYYCPTAKIPTSPMAEKIQIAPHCNLFKEKKGEHWLVSNSTYAPDIGFDSIGVLSEDRLSVMLDNKWGYVDTTYLTIIIRCEYNFVGNFHNGFARVDKEGFVKIIDRLGNPWRQDKSIVTTKNEIPMVPTPVEKDSDYFEEYLQD